MDTQTETTKRGDKTEAVRELLAKGIDSPTQIAEELKKQGIEINPAHVSTIKGNLKRKGELPKRRGRPPGSRNRIAEAEEWLSPVPEAARKTRKGGLTSEDL